MLFNSLKELIPFTSPRICVVLLFTKI